MMALSCSIKLSALVRGITSKHQIDFYCLNCLNFYESYKSICENKDFFNVIMPSEITKVLEFNKCQISDEPLFIIYVDLECLIEDIDGCKSKP